MSVTSEIVAITCHLNVMILYTSLFFFRYKDGIVNPTVRKDMKGPQKLYCCPIEGCPRGPNRPFSQFSLVKQVQSLVFYITMVQSVSREKYELYHCFDLLLT